MHWLTLANSLAGLLLLGQTAASVIDAPDVAPRLGRAYNGLLDGGRPSNFTLSRRQSTSPQCGAAANGARCTNNLCCSQWGFCGSSDMYCSNVAGCQPAYGVCEGSITTTTSATTTTSSTSSSSTSTVTTTTSSTSVTTSSSTTSSSSSSSSQTASPTVGLPPGQSTTPDGTCGNNKSCLGWSFGQCCSQWGYCGSGDTYCSLISGCQANYGICEGSGSTTSPGVPSTTSSSTSSSSTSTVTTTSGTTSTSSTSSSASASPTASLPPGQTPTTDGTCGNNKSCLGWQYGQCCSQFGYCGSSDVYCSPISGCQASFGICDAA